MPEVRYGACTVTQTSRARTTIPDGTFPTWIVLTTLRVPGSIRATVPPLDATQTAPSPNAIAAGP